MIREFLKLLRKSDSTLDCISHDLLIQIAPKTDKGEAIIGESEFWINSHRLLEFLGCFSEVISLKEPLASYIGSIGINGARELLGEAAFAAFHQ